MTGLGQAISAQETGDSLGFRVAVLPFEFAGIQESPEATVWGEGLTHMMSAILDGSPDLRVSDRALLAEMVRNGELARYLQLEQFSEIEGADYVVAATYNASSNRKLHGLQLRMFKVADSRQIASYHLNERAVSAGGVPKHLFRFAVRAAETMGIRVDSQVLRMLPGRSTAVRQFIEAASMRDLALLSDQTEAIELYQSAIRLIEKARRGTRDDSWLNGQIQSIQHSLSLIEQAAN